MELGMLKKFSLEIKNVICRDSEDKTFLGVHSVKDEIFKPVSFLLEEITVKDTSEIQSCVVGGAAVQTQLFSKGLEKYLRKTPDVDMVASERLSRNKFKNYVKPHIEEFNEIFNNLENPYSCSVHTKGKQNTICINKIDDEIEIKSELDLLFKGDRMLIHFPRYSKKVWEQEKNYDLKAINTSEIKNVHDHNFKCSNVEITVEGKIRRIYDKTKDCKKVKEAIDIAFKKIEKPTKFKQEIDQLRYLLGNAYEFETKCKSEINNNNSSIVSRIRDALAIEKDSYDIAALNKVKKIDDVIEQELKKLEKN